ncbi:natural killer cells antigen CD94-like [Erinaceus europaeus]|uniref:Natural killer cells antigen CD94 n=1 Tax=Erinaceus europaeus TaxID=9365 RepID=A0A1S3W2B1_ERIEU|nr:natural killer cells antigen CD94-like [Erinaceus europaeus]
MAAVRTTQWRWISGFLGVMCLALAMTLGILCNNKFTKNIQPTTTPGPTMEPQEDTDCCFCQQRWVGYECNCYFISSDMKSWAESREFCASQNSSLLQIHSKDELSFMKSNKHFYWIGASYNAKHHAWLWENGSTVSIDLFPVISTFNTAKCIVYSPTKSTLDELCSKNNRYICKKKTTVL